ncbi:MAG: integrase core domain-containing protein [bacterium]|nr:integrase core domain-containing protein [bacterium]
MAPRSQAPPGSRTALQADAGEDALKPGELPEAGFGVASPLGVVFPSNNPVLQRLVESAQYTAGAFAAACRRLGIARSSGRTGNALDNAPAESFFSTLQHELIDRRAWATKAQARQEIAMWVHGWYNHHRLHSAIGMVPPVEYEMTHTANPHNQPLHD